MTYIFLQRVCDFASFGGRQVYFTYFSMTLAFEIKIVSVFGLFPPKVRTVVLGRHLLLRIIMQMSYQSCEYSADDTLYIVGISLPVLSASGSVRLGSSLQS